METILREKRFDFIRQEDKRFIREFTTQLEERGYTWGGAIGSGYCWGRYMVIYQRAGVKTKRVVARIYIREDGIALRLFLNNVTRHASYIREAPALIREVFTGTQGTCKHCNGDDCRFRKDYVIDGVAYEKCNGITFTFSQPTCAQLFAYLGLFDEFYPQK